MKVGAHSIRVYVPEPHVTRARIIVLKNLGSFGQPSPALVRLHIQRCGPPQSLEEPNWGMPETLN